MIIWKMCFYVVCWLSGSGGDGVFGHMPITVTESHNPKGQALVVVKDKCEGMHGAISLNFRNVGLQRIESDFADSPNVSCLNLEENGIVYVSPNAFRRMPNLLYLNLARNQLALGNLSRLEGHPQLRTLILDGNGAEAQDKAACPSLRLINIFPRLINIYLRGNGLRDIESLAFAPRISHLYLSSNNLGASELGFLEEAPETLLTLDLANNGISYLNASWLPQVEELRLEGNRLERLCGKSYCRESALILEGLTALRRLFLARNGLTSIESDALDDAESLRELDLSHNKIDSVRKSTFERASQLRSLSLRANLLREVPDLYGPEALEHLSLADNHLIAVTNNSFLEMDKLTWIDLSNNRIKTLEAGAFAKQTALEVLDLSNNRLVTFPVKWMRQLVNLMILYVNGNRLRRLDDLKLDSGKNTTKLKHVFLQNNAITKLYTSSLFSAFKAIPNVTLEFFDASDRPNRLSQAKK